MQFVIMISFHFGIFQMLQNFAFVFKNQQIGEISGKKCFNKLVDIFS